MRTFIAALLIFIWAGGAEAQPGSSFAPSAPDFINGNVVYKGNEKGSVIVEAFLNPDFQRRPVASARLDAPGSFTIKVKAGVYYLRAFIDRNGNGKPDPDEPVGEGNANGVILTPLGARARVDIELMEAKR